MYNVHPHTRQMVQAGVSDRGVALTGGTRALMEHCFGRKLDAVRLHFSRASGEANRALGSVAFTVDHHICFCPGFDPTYGAAFTEVLAHEIAHVVQKEAARNGRVRPSAAATQLEHEAGRAAMAVAGERHVPKLSGDLWRGPRCWGVQGHYYTVLWASLAAGLSFEEAQRNAFFTQMPDQVRELDATPSGVFWGADLGGSVYASLNAHTLKVISLSPSLLAVYLNANPWVAQYWTAKADELINDAVVKWEVQAGLHALTGKDPKDEQATRRRTLMHLKRDTFEFSLALHPYGDSFAHQDFTDHPKMYAAPAGHLLQGDNADNIHIRADKYVPYGTALYDLFIEKCGIKKPPVTRDKFVTALADVTKEEKGDMQTAGILGYASIALSATRDENVLDSLDALNGVYRPENAQTYFFHRAPQTWSEFFTENQGRKDIGLKQNMKDRALDCAEQWVGGAKPCGLPPKEEIEARLADAAIFFLEHSSYWP